MHDARTKGRMRLDRLRHKRGTDNHLSKLTDEQVSDIRNLYATGRFTYQILANHYQVTASCIGAIITRETWSHLL